MFINKLFLKFKYPLLKFVTLNEMGGCYTRSGGDVLLLSVLFNSFLNNRENYIIELNKPLKEPYSISNLFLRLFSCSAILINTDKRFVFIYGLKQPEELDLPLYPTMPAKEEVGLEASHEHSSKVYEYSSDETLLQALLKGKVNCACVILNYETDSVVILKGLIKDLTINAVLIQNNTSGSLHSGNDLIRKFLLMSGFIFYVRLNNNDDLFVLSEYLNGFPSKDLKMFNTTSLQKWVSIPPDSDYTKPR